MYILETQSNISYSILRYLSAYDTDQAQNKLK